jgi:hypothetical protein
MGLGPNPLRRRGYVGRKGGDGMTQRLKLLSEAYRNVAQAPTQTYIKGTILDDLERMIEEEIKNIKKLPEPVKLSPDDEIPF